jgi:hypothetical protein
VTHDSSATPIERWLLIVAVLGFVVPNGMVAAFAIDHGVSGAATDYLEAWFASLPSTQLAADLVLCSAAFLVWAAVDGRRHHVAWWVAVPATFLVGLCFAVPLYLWLRERARRLGPAPRTQQQPV